MFPEQMMYWPAIVSLIVDPEIKEERGSLFFETKHSDDMFLNHLWDIL